MKNDPKTIRNDPKTSRKHPAKDPKNIRKRPENYPKKPPALDHLTAIRRLRERKADRAFYFTKSASTIQTTFKKNGCSKQNETNQNK